MILTILIAVCGINEVLHKNSVYIARLSLGVINTIVESNVADASQKSWTRAFERARNSNGATPTQCENPEKEKPRSMTGL